MANTMEDFEEEVNDYQCGQTDPALFADLQLTHQVSCRILTMTLMLCLVVVLEPSARHVCTTSSQKPV
jgi:hypothetical protein